MNEVIKINCYIQEYKINDSLMARLRDKKTDKIVVITGQNVNKGHFLQFLSQIKINNQIAPTVYEKDGEDIVAVRGYLISETDEKMEVCVDIETGGYMLE